MALNILYEKKLIAETVERVIENTGEVFLVDVPMVGRSYPFKQNVPGVWVSGPDRGGRYTVSISVAINGLLNIPVAINNMRARIWNELKAVNLADRIGSVDVTVEDLMTAA